MLFVNSQNFVLFLILHQFLLRCFYFHLQVDELLGEPIGGLHGGFEFGLEILLNIGTGERVHNLRGKIRIGAAVMNINDASIGNESYTQAAFEGSQNCRGACRIGLQSIRSQVRRGIRRASELRALVQVQLLDHLQREQITLQNSDFGIKIGGIVVIHSQSAAGVFEVNQPGINFIDRDPTARFVNRGCLQGGDRDQRENSHQAEQHRKFELD